MTSEELELIDRHIGLILAIQYRGMNAGQRQHLEQSLAEIKVRYEEAANKRDAKDADEKTQTYYAGICTSVIKGLPDIAKGALAAAKAFEKGDYLSGSAGIMDICAAGAPIIGSLFTAGGPPGALIGA